VVTYLKPKENLFMQLIKTIFFCLILSVISANAAIKTWDGGGADTNWTTAANWVGDVAAVANDDLVFPASATAATVNNNFFFFTTFRSITFQGGTYTVSGNPLNLTQGLTAVDGTHVVNTLIGLSGSQTISNGQLAFTTLAVVSIGANTLTIDGNGNCGIGVISGSGQVVKTGIGGSLIATSSGFSGSYTADNGFFIIDANTPNSSLTINANGAVGGTGTISNVVVNSGTLSAGTVQSPTGILNTKNISFTNLGIAAFKIGGTTPGTTGHDQLNVTGTVTLGGSQIAPIAWNGFVPAIGDSFLLINNDGGDAINGTFINLPEGSTLSALGLIFRISYIGGTGNDVVLKRVNQSYVDFDGDGKTDISVFRPAVGEWYYQRSSNSVVNGAAFGSLTDKPVPADYTGDGKTDFTFFRPSTGQWFILRSEDSSFFAFPFGISTDILTAGDFDGDGKADQAVFRPSNGVWYINKSTGGVTIQPFGTNGDRPVAADYDGDGKSDIAIFRPSVGEWYYLRSSDSQVRGAQFGSPTDKTVQADYTGDGKADFAFFRPSTGSWFVLRSEDSSFYASPFGVATDTPTIGDYDGDGKFDQAVFRPSNGVWYINKSNGSGVTIQPFGAAMDIPAPSYYLP
jgi:FG-GAP-like repeat